MQEVDVLIVGGGPVGTALALELSLQKISFRLVDKEAQRSDKSRALVVQCRTQELLSRHGDMHKLVDNAQKAHGAAAFINRKLAVKFSIDDLGLDDTEFPLPALISQVPTEQFLESCLTSYGGKVERPVSVKPLEVGEDAVVATLLKGTDGADGEEKIRCKYVVGCDGAHSVVRHSSSIMEFEGSAYPQCFFLCDCHLDGSNLPLDRVLAFMTQKFLYVIPLKDGVVRLAISGRGIDEKQEPTLEVFQAALDEVAPPGAGTLRDPIWLTQFHLHHRGVNTYRDGRLFVAGDAAHIHSPVGGQGMNTGIQDAINLGWKLAAVLRGEAADPEALLDSYNGERRPVGRALLDGSDRAFEFIASLNPAFLWLRNLLLPNVLPLLVRTEAQRMVLMKVLSEFGISYRTTSAIAATASGFDGTIRGGDRLTAAKLRAAGPGGAETTLQRLVRGPGHHLFLFTGPGKYTATEAELDEARNKVVGAVHSAVDTHVIHSAEPNGASGYVDLDGAAHKQYGFIKPGYIFVRPDSYIAHIGSLDKLDQLLQFIPSYLK